MDTIEKSVGKGGSNLSIDVIKVQNLLNNNDMYTTPVCWAPGAGPAAWQGLTGAARVSAWGAAAGLIGAPRTPGLPGPVGFAAQPWMSGGPTLPVTGLVDEATILAIETFQINHPDLTAVDGRVDPKGQTFSKLQAYNNYARQCRSFLPFWFAEQNIRANFNVDQFVELYAHQYPSPKLSGARHSGLKALVEKIVADINVRNIGWAAYMLATVKHECANTWQPIEEYGKGAGHPYGNPIEVTDPATKKKYKNTYYGRGYVQLTWENNYKTMDRALGLSGAASLHLHPEKALDAGTAYDIMSYGMRNGSFTGKRLSDYIGTSTDYRNARRIINALDQADLIKGYAERIEYLLRFCNGKLPR